jgi:hypothetical protein
MMYPYADFLLAFDRKNGGLIHRNRPENTRAAFIVETRPLYFAPKVIRNVMYFLGPRWNLYVLCGELSHDYLATSLRDWGINCLKLQNVHRLSIPDYNRLMTSPALWNSFSEEKILVFQSDALLTGPNVEDFESYDFIGAPCGQFDEQYIANGGLSLRTRAVMLQCLAKFSVPEGIAEDVFFTKAVRTLGASMPDMGTAARFAVESIYRAHPFGVHGTDKCYHSVGVAEEIVRGIIY